MTTISAITQDQKLIPTDTPTVAAGDKKTVSILIRHGMDLQRVRYSLLLQIIKPMKLLC